MNKQNVVFLD